MVMTATSVVPPPRSTIMTPFGCMVSTPAPMAAARGSSMRQALPAPLAVMTSRMVRRSRFVTVPGMLTMMFGLKISFLQMIRMK